MKATASKPELLKQSDIVSFYHIQVPRWLFADKRYKHLSLAAKMAYSFLLNRYQLSKLHGWVNDTGEVYVIFPREELAEELQIGAHKAISVFKELSDAGLVWEKRRGNNKANHIYLTRVMLSEEYCVSHNSAPFMSGSAETACPDEPESVEASAAVCPHGEFGHAKNAPPKDMRDMHVRECGNHTSGGAKIAAPDMRKLHASNTYLSYIENSDTELSQSVSHERDKPDRRTDDEIAELDKILEGCELYAFSPETAKVFENSIERLYFSESYRIGNCVLPQKRVRSHLWELDFFKLQTAEQKILRNTEKEIRNTTAYVMAVIFNSIWESESDLMTDPYLNSLRNMPPGAPEERSAS